MRIEIAVNVILIAVLWNADNVQSVLLTSTLITGMMGGYLIGRMPLGTFLGALTNNASLPSLPSVTSLLPSLPTFSPRQEEQKKATEKNSSSQVTPSVAQPAPTPMPYAYPSYPTYPAYPQYLYPTPAPTPSFSYPFPNFYSGNGIYNYNNLFTTTTTTAAPSMDIDLSLLPIKPVDVPLSLDNKIRERFIRQLAVIDPLNCLPKTFCEVTSDPYRAVMALDKGSILGMSSIHKPMITREELIAYEAQLPTRRPPPPPSTSPTTTTTTTTEKPENDDGDDDSHSGSDEDQDHDRDNDQDQEEDDIDSGSHSEENSEEVDEDDDSFELYRKEHEHKVEMQALDEMIDEIDDPETYTYILRDKKKRKEAMKKFRRKHNKNGGFGSAEAGFRHEPFNREAMNPDYLNEESSIPLSRRTGSDVNYPPPPLPVPPLPPQPPPMLPQPSFFRRATTEPPISDMFADDPFFDDVSGTGRNARHFRGIKKSGGRRRGKRDLIGDPLTQYRLAYIVAEKYKNPNLCNVAFPSCPYQTKTIMSVVNRLESGLLPFGKPQINRYRDQNRGNNLEHFKNTLVAIERLNKATMDAKARGEPIDIEEMTEVASSPTSEIDANTSQDIVNEFQRVVAKIQASQFTKRRLQLEKAKPLNGDRPRTNYDAVHYYKKAQMDDLKPKERLKTGILDTKTNVRQQNDEANDRNAPTFKETYRQMFKKNNKRANRRTSGNRGTAKDNSNLKKESNPGQKSDRNKTKSKPNIPKFPEIGEDDERDAKNDEEAIDAMITQGKPKRSRLVKNM